MNAIDPCDCPPETRRRDADGHCFSCGGTLPDCGADNGWGALAILNERGEIDRITTEFSYAAGMFKVYGRGGRR